MFLHGDVFVISIRLLLRGWSFECELSYVFAFENSSSDELLDLLSFSLLSLLICLCLAMSTVVCNG